MPNIDSGNLIYSCHHHHAAFDAQRVCDGDSEGGLEGGGGLGAEEVKAHPWFAGVEWGLHGARVLPPPSVPTYTMELSRSVPREKIENQYLEGGDPVAAEMAERAAAADTQCDAGDEAVFAAIEFVDSDFITRSVLAALTELDGPGAVVSSSSAPAGPAGGHRGGRR